MKKYSIIAAIVIGAFFLGKLMSPNKVSESVKTVEVVKWKTRVVRTTKPDGTTIEEIIRESVRERVKDKIVVFDVKQYLVSLSTTPQTNPTYMLSVSKKFILGSYLGVYGRTDGEYGLTVSYRF